MVKGTYKKYDVVIVPKIPTYDDNGRDRGVVVTVNGRNKKEAISAARRRNRIEGHYDRHSGPLTYTAKEADDA